MKKLGGILCLVGLTAAFAALLLMAPSPAPQAGPPCISCPLQPLPDECPPCTQWAPQTCRKCAHCERIKGCQT